MKQRERFGSRLGFILVSAGCAVGLGNVWKFPYICGENGGAAFILIYLLFLILLGLPILICEFSIGRGSRLSLSMAYEKLEPKGTKWHHFKWLAIAGNYLLLMFYTMIAGWMLYYAYLYCTGKMTHLDNDAIVQQFNHMLSSPQILIFWTVIAILVSFGICALGLQNGIEKITKIMMIILLFLMIILAVHSLTLNNAIEGVKFYLVPNFNKIKEIGLGSVIFAAMTHAFFTLSIGMGSMEIFGSYLSKDRSIPGEAGNILFVDTFVAITAGLIIIPACFAYGVEPDRGPDLLFITLPNVFSHMFAGNIWGAAFFVFMTFAALSTVIAVGENLNSFFMDMCQFSRKKAVSINLIGISILSLPAILGYNLWSHIAPLGEGSTIMDFEDFLVSYNVLPLGGLILVLFCTRQNGWGFEHFIKEANTGKGIVLPGWIRFYMTYILPFIIVLVYLKGYYDMFSSKDTATFVGSMAFAVALLVAIFFVRLYRPKEAKQVSSNI